MTVEKCKALAGRSVYLYPDLSRDESTFKLRRTRASEIAEQIPGVRLKVMDLLEKTAGVDDREDGANLADYLIRHDWRAFRLTDREAAPLGSIDRVAQPRADHAGKAPRPNPTSI